MSIYDKASLVLIPSGTKTSKVYSQKPVSGDGDFTFSRSTAATRVNADGNIEKETQNLLLESNSFNTTWVKSSVSVTSGQSGYDGTSDAWLLSKSGASAFIRQFVSVSGVYTFSVYAKAGSLNWIRLFMAGGVSGTSYFDLQNGVVGTTSGSPIDTKIESVGSGWYRCSVTHNDSSFSNFRIYPADADNDTSGTSGNIYIQDAQLNQGLIAQEVITTTTTAIYGGITDNVPRLDYTDSSCPALLLEPQRTNAATDSEYFDIYTKSNATITNNDSLSPERLTNATSFAGNGATSSHYIYRNFGTAVSGTAYTISFFAKSGSLDYVQLVMGSSAFGVLHQNFDLANGTIGSSSGSVTPFIESYTDEWYRVGITITATASATITPFIALANSSTMSRLASFATSGDVKIYGLQIEAGSYATSYIPTYGSAVTRNVDSCSKTSVSSLIGQTEGTLFAEFEINADNTNGYNRVLAVGDGTSNNRIFIFAQNTEVFRFYVANGGAAQVDIVSTTSILGGRHKVAFAYKANDFIAYVDGVQVGTDTSGTIPSCSNIYVGTHEAGSTQPLEGELNQAMLFPTRLTNAELADLTTL